MGAEQVLAGRHHVVAHLGRHLELDRSVPVPVPIQENRLQKKTTSTANQSKPKTQHQSRPERGAP